jgi:hypothetical protein
LIAPSFLSKYSVLVTPFSLACPFLIAPSFLSKYSVLVTRTIKNGQAIENGVNNTEYLERNEGAIKNGQARENGVTNTEYLERN